MSIKQVSKDIEVDERLAALSTNTNAIKAIASAVEGTLGPKGLDTMLVDKFGDVVITNDGVTILELMEVNHPAARMMINTAKAQQDEIGDGTTTASIMAGSLVTEGLEQINRGVPVTRVIEGIKAGIKMAVQYFKDSATVIERLDDSVLKEVSWVAGRGNDDIAELVFDAANMIGREKLLDSNFKLSDCIFAQHGADNQLIKGCIINKERVSQDMPRELSSCSVLFIDDALEPEQLDEEALSNEAGFNRFIKLQEEFQENLKKLLKLNVGLVVVDRGIHDLAEEFFIDAGIMAVQRVSHKELKKAAEFTGARMIKRTGLKKTVDELRNYLGKTEKAYEDEHLQQIRVLDGSGKPMATILVGAATEEVVGERERIAKDAAAALQAAIKGGIVPGGGSIELAAASFLENNREQVRGMAVYGINCVVEALKKPFSQIVFNAGFNPLEKQGDVLALQKQKGNTGYAIDCDTGQAIDMRTIGIVDPVLVKIYALKAAGEIAEAILRIDTIIKKRADRSADNRANEEFDF
ncbi:MAG: chaperonin [Desulfitibacter sp. BRH_c19]|nr:MAG: chaperonin [Desulfitibacter sp. BRH_c19]